MKEPTQPGLHLRPLELGDLDELMAIEVGSYPFPWSRGNFVDSLSNGYQALGLWMDDALVAYCWAMEGVEELHLLNLTVHSEHRRRGHAQRLLDVLVDWAVPRALWWMWLEVRASNQAARSLYESYGFDESGLRRGYYPNVRSSREDAVLMRLDMRQRLESMKPGSDVVDGVQGALRTP
jgi:ribosomal-protein-alanine N-acetyltransferase